MAGEFPIAKVGDLATSVSDTHKMKEANLIFLNTSDILHGKILHRSYTRVKDWPGQAKKSIRRNDILFSEIRPANGRWAYVDEECDDFVVSTKLMVIRVRTEVASPRYLYQFITSKETSGWLQHLAESRSGTFPQITFDQVASLDIPLPPLQKQKAIASVLGTLDELIEVNCEINETLEQMARALFKSWFVDFDPVRAKLEGRSPAGMDAATAALFPDHFQDSELGQIPRGWRVERLEAIASVGSGKRPEGRRDISSSDCNIPLYGGGGRMGYVSSSLYEHPILFTGRVGTLGIIFRTSEPSWPSDNTLIVEPQTGFFDFTYFVLKGFDLITLNRGSTQPLLTQTDLKRQMLVIPTEVIVKSFADFTEPIFRQMASNERESRDLATLRDTLLPKLLSGEVSVSAAKEVVYE